MSIRASFLRVCMCRSLSETRQRLCGAACSVATGGCGGVPLSVTALSTQYATGPQRRLFSHSRRRENRSSGTNWRWWVCMVYLAVQLFVVCRLTRFLLVSIQANRLCSLCCSAWSRRNKVKLSSTALTALRYRYRYHTIPVEYLHRPNCAVLSCR